MADYDKIPDLKPIRHAKDFFDFIANFISMWDELVRAIRLIKSELKRLQSEKQDV